MPIERAVLSRLRRLRDSAREYREKCLETDTRAILAQDGEPQTLDNEEVFERLQSDGSGVSEYGYQSFDKWRRGMLRALELIELSGLREPGARTLEVGAGDGITSYALSTFGHKPIAADFEDWRSGGGKTVEFHRLDASTQPLPLDDGSMDLAFSYMTFEHLIHPDFALHEMIRVTRPGGRIHLSFGPPYASPWGLHAYRSLKMPYPQYLFSREFIHQKLKQLGISDLGGERDSLQPLNGWLIRQYDALWENAGAELEFRKLDRDLSHVKLIHAYPQCFRGRGLRFEDVVTTLVEVTLRKPS